MRRIHSFLMALWLGLGSVAAFALTSCEDDGPGASDGGGDVDTGDATRDGPGDTSDSGTDDQQVVICPTEPWSTPEERFLNSLDTLNEFLEVVESHTDGELTIQLLDHPCPGQDAAATYYDFSAVIIPYPEDRNNPPSDFDFIVQSWDASTAFVWNPLHLEYSVGLPIVGRDNITIQGPALIRGNDDPAVLGDVNCVISPGSCATPGSSALAFANLLFQVYGPNSFDEFDGELPDDPAENITFRHLTFENAGKYIAAYGSTRNLTIVDNVFRADSFDQVEAWEDVQGLVIERNRFYTDLPPDHPYFFQIAVNLGGVPPDVVSVQGAIIEDNEFVNVFSAMRLTDHVDGVVVRDNRIELHPNGTEGIQALAGSHGVPPHFPPTAGDSEIVGNDISGGNVGITVYNGSDWIIRDNTIEDTVQGIWTEWGPMCFPDAGVVRLTPAQNLLVQDNTIRDSQYGIYIGAYTRDSSFISNDVEHNETGYFLNGSQSFYEGYCDLNIRFSAPSGNTIVLDPGDDPDTLVVNHAECSEACDDDGDSRVDEDPYDAIDNDHDGARNEDAANGPDDDLDGATDEDAIDGIDNDSDGVTDEDPVHQTNVIRVEG